MRSIGTYVLYPWKDASEVWRGWDGDAPTVLVSVPLYPPLPVCGPFGPFISSYVIEHVVLRRHLYSDGLARVVMYAEPHRENIVRRECLRLLAYFR